MFSDAFNGNFTQVLSKQLTCTLKKPTKVSNNWLDKNKFPISTMKTRYYNCYYNSKALSF